MLTREASTREIPASVFLALTLSMQSRISFTSKVLQYLCKDYSMLLWTIHKGIPDVAWQRVNARLPKPSGTSVVHVQYRGMEKGGQECVRGKECSRRGSVGSSVDGDDQRKWRVKVSLGDRRQ